MLRVAVVFLVLCVFASCKPRGDFDDYVHPPVPDYSQSAAWACLPTTHNASDTVPPFSGESDMQATAKVDVFYIYPTLDFSADNWNADIYDAKLNSTIEKTAVRVQASVFNGCCKVYAPRYRQGTLASFYDKNGTGNGGKALQLAYSDIRSAFQYYIKNYNNGRPFIIAGHSQGTLMAYKLLQEFVDTTSLRKQLVCAYLVGFHIQKDFFKNLKASDSAAQTGCYITWNTVEWGGEKSTLSRFFSGVCTNPLTWRQDTAYADAKLNLGSVNYSFKKIDEHEVGAAIRGGVLTVSPPTDGGYRTFRTGYHIYDYNFFYMNIRKNVQQRVDAYFKSSR
ncbi:MAG TPA: DUF3089 domain-containing protein [Bacteroidia bacterium]|nr:DUF3089 domain-containing protein [Bacteroidia bacterium]